MSHIIEEIARASSVRDVNPQQALDIVTAVRATLESGAPPGKAESATLWQAECAQNAAWANFRLGRFGAAFSEAEDGRRLFSEIDHAQGVAGCILVMGLARSQDGRNDEALKHLLLAEALFEKIGDRVGLARAINASGTSHRRLGDSARAIEAYGKSMVLSESNGDSRGVARALTNIGYVYLQERKFEQAMEHARRAIEMERRHGNLSGEIGNCCNLILALVGTGRAQEALDFMAAYDLEELSKSGLITFLELCQSLATAYMEVGRTAEAEALLRLGIERARRDSNHRELGTLLCTLARLHRTAPAKDRAEREMRFIDARFELEEALAHGQSRDLDFVQGAHEEFCALCRDEGKWDEAFGHLEAAHRIALTLSSASADERLARLRSEQEAAGLKARADAEARQHEIERKVLQSQKTESLGVLAGGMVHHFNNLLTTILGNAELGQLNADLVPGALAEIKASGRRAADLCQQLIMYTGGSGQRNGAVEVRELVEASIKLLRVTLVADCSFVREFPEYPLFAWGDTVMFQQIILNLVNNAVEARATAVVFKASVVRCEPPSRVPAESLEPGEYVELRVTDNGGGMAPEVLARVFEPFYSTRSTGRGLGLPAAMGLARANKGTLAVESAPGSGTVVRVFLPRSRETAPQEAKPEPSPSAKRGARVVLIADDEEAVRGVLVKFMGRLGWKTLEAADGDEAIRTHRDHSGQIDLLLCDYFMPRVNGLQAALQIRSLNPKLPVIMMSGFTKEDAGDNFRSAGFRHFLKKPFELRELKELLKAAGPA
jgi:signal transduction histidine kinase/CheY-like chemotaxis protein